MKCAIIRMIVSWSADYDRKLPKFCARHVMECEECRAFVAFTGSLDAGLRCVDHRTRVEINRRLTASAPAAPYLKGRAVSLSAVLAALLLVALAAVYVLPNKHLSGSPAASSTAIMDLAVEDAGMMQLEIGAEGMLRNEISALGGEVRSLITSLPLLPIDGDG